MKILRTALLYWLPVLAWMAVINSLSATPAQYIPRIDILHIDKAFHITEFFVLGALLMRAMGRSVSTAANDSLAKMAVLAIIISLCYGAFDELFQRSIPGRSCNISDFLTDAAGAAAGIIAYAIDANNRRVQHCHR